MNLVRAPHHARWTAAVAIGAAVIGLAVALSGTATSGGGTSPEAQRLLAEKARLLQKPAQIARPNVTKPKVADVRPARSTAANTESGIRTDTEAPASASMFRAVNRWQGEIQGRRYTVYAGRAGEDATRGRILILAKDAAGLRTVAPKWLDTAGSGGALRIVSARGGVLVLRAEDGTGYRLDPVSGRLSAA